MEKSEVKKKYVDGQVFDSQAMWYLRNRFIPRFTPLGTFQKNFAMRLSGVTILSGFRLWLKPGTAYCREETGKTLIMFIVIAV